MGLARATLSKSGLSVFVLAARAISAASSSCFFGLALVSLFQPNTAGRSM
ncbi:hypothetical protein IMZ48_02225 [Candidatus Bathyarchaeota archaeon]|nr:hypothetical protein [Candidatus Bathyarchaeota archaeon]